MTSQAAFREGPIAKVSVWMPYVVELYFDAITEAAIGQIWQAIAEAGLNSPMLEAGYRPHISLSVYRDDLGDIAGLQQDVARYAQLLTPLTVKLSQIGLFPASVGVIFLGVTPTQQLLELHANFHRVFEKYAAYLRPNYEIGNWVPHCTLSFGISAEEVAEIIPICWRISLPINGQV